MVTLKKKMNQDEVIRLCKVMVDLTDNPHPGLASWNIMCQETVQKLADELVDDDRLHSLKE